MPSRQAIKSRHKPREAICSKEAFSTFIGELLYVSFADLKPKISQTRRCKEHIIHAFDVYTSAKSYDANYILQEMRELHQAASRDIVEPSSYTANPMSTAACNYRKRVTKQYCATCEHIGNLSAHARANIFGRLQNRPVNSSAVIIDPNTLLLSKEQCDGPISLLPGTQRAYCEFIASLSRIGMRLRAGKRRPSGRRSRACLAVDPFGPEPQPQPQKKGAERELESLLAVAWLELTGDATRKHPRYVAFIQTVLEQVGSEENTDADFLVNEARRKVDRARQKSKKT